MLLVKGLAKSLESWPKTGQAVLAIGLVALSACASEPTPPPGGPTGLSVVTFPQAGRSGEPLDPAPVVQLIDAGGSAVERRGVTIVATPDGNATLDGTAELRTDDAGRVRFTGLAIRGTVGSYRVRFTASGLPAAVSSPVAISAGVPSRMVALRGLNLTGEVGQPLGESPTVKVEDGSGNPVPNTDITFAVTGGGGSLVGAATKTAPDGTASAGQWILGPQTGMNTLTVTLPSSTTSIEFTATAVLGAPATVAVVDSTPSAIAGTSLDSTIRVKVTDRSGNPIPGIRVAFSVSAGGGTILGATPLTNSAGIAVLQKWTLGPEAGENTLSAAVTGLPPTVVRAMATAVPVQIVAGKKPAGFVSDTLGDSLVVRVVNGANQAKAGVTVNFQVVAGGGSISPATAVTDTAGRAAATWVLGPTPGKQTARVSAVGAAPTDADVTAERFTSISAGWRHTCGLAESGDAYCWGTSDYKNLGADVPQFGIYPNPIKVAGGIKFTWVEVSAGGNFSCGLSTDSLAYCWGSNGHGQRGDGSAPTTQNAAKFPTLVVGGHKWKQLSVGGDHACGIATDNLAYCWGSNTGSIGDGTIDDRHEPTLVSGGMQWNTIAAGQAHTCAINVSDQLYCWGLRIAFAPGSGQYFLSPTLINTSLIFVDVAAAWVHTCARTAAGVGYCWGQNSFGQTGTGVNSQVPAIVAGGHTWASIIGRGNTTCGRTTGGVGDCWGENSAGEVGDGTANDALLPTLVSGGLTFSAIAGGGAYSCGLVGHRPYCWGQNVFAQLGDGTRQARVVPVKVRF